MTTKISSAAAKLFEDKNLAFLATLNKDNSPQVTPIWIDIMDGLIVVNTAIGRVKQKNLSRDPRVAISIVDRNNPYHMVTIQGRVIEQSTVGADDHIDKMTKKYLDLEKYPFARPGEKRIIFKILPEKIFHLQPNG